MNILLFNHYATPPSLPGITRHYDYGRLWVKKGHDVTVVTSAFVHNTFVQWRCREGQPYEVEFVDGVRFVWVQTPKYSGNTRGRLRNMVRFGWSAPRTVFHLVRTGQVPPPDVTIGSAMHQLAGFDALVVARHFRVPFVYEVRDLWPETLVTLKHRSGHSLEVLLIGAASKILYRQAAAVVTLLAGSEPRICQYGVPAEKVVCIPNGIDVSRVHGLTLAADSRHDSDVFTVLYAGTIGFSNALDQLIAASAVLQEQHANHIKVVIMGEGPELERLKAEVKRQGLHNVAFRDAVPKERVYSHLANADCLFIGTRPGRLLEWGMSQNKLVDYLAVGRPIIMACDVQTNAVLASEAGLVVPSDSPARLADAMLHIASLPLQSRLAMGERGAAFAAAELDLSKFVTKYENLLLHLVAR